MFGGLLLTAWVSGALLYLLGFTSLAKRLFIGTVLLAVAIPVLLPRLQTVATTCLTVVSCRSLGGVIGLALLVVLGIGFVRYTNHRRQLQKWVAVDLHPPSEKTRREVEL